MEDNERLRSKRKKLRVTFPDGTVFCNKNVTITYIDALKAVGSSRFPEIKLELARLPLMSQEVYPRLKDYMKPVCDGWYVNTQSDTTQKYLQLRAINDALQLGLTVELGDFDAVGESSQIKSKGKSKLMVRFPDGEYIASNNSSETFMQSLWKIGFERITRLPLEICGRPIFSRFQTRFHTIQVDTDLWLSQPGSTKDRARLLKMISVSLRLNLEITVI